MEVRRLTWFCRRKKKKNVFNILQNKLTFIKVFIDKCSFSAHFQLVSVCCVTQLLLSCAFFPFVEQKTFMYLQCSVKDQQQKTKLNQVLIKLWGRICYVWKTVWVQLMKRKQEMTIINWGGLYCNFGASGKNYKAAQNFRVSVN